MIAAKRRGGTNGAARVVRTRSHAAELPLGIGDLARLVRQLLEAGHEPEGLLDRVRHIIEIQAGDIASLARQDELRRRVAEARQATTDEHG